MIKSWRFFAKKLVKQLFLSPEPFSNQKGIELTCRLLPTENFSLCTLLLLLRPFKGKIQCQVHQGNTNTFDGAKIKWIFATWR